ncbi:MAG: hypothetical protein GXP41_01425 [Chloroflexi bacterium]|nr:hypothetical protein [Chloroflexota bacterium]
MTSISFWGSIASILLVLELAVVITAMGVLLFLAHKGIAWLINNLPTYTRRVLGYVQQAKRITRSVSRRLASPFIVARSTWAGIIHTWQRLRTGKE